MAVDTEKIGFRWANNSFRVKFISSDYISFEKPLLLVKWLPWLNDNKLFWSDIDFCLHYDFFCKFNHQFSWMIFKELILSQKMLNKLQMMIAPIKRLNLHKLIKFLFWAWKDNCHFFHKIIIRILNFVSISGAGLRSDISLFLCVIYLGVWMMWNRFVTAWFLCNVEIEPFVFIISNCLIIFWDFLNRSHSSKPFLSCLHDQVFAYWNQ